MGFNHCLGEGLGSEGQRTRLPVFRNKERLERERYRFHVSVPTDYPGVILPSLPPPLETKVEDLTRLSRSTPMSSTDVPKKRTNKRKLSKIDLRPFERSFVMKLRRPFPSREGRDSIQEFYCCPLLSGVTGEFHGSYRIT